MSVFALIGWMVGISLAYMTAVWVMSLIVQNAGIVDSFWGPGFVLLAVVGPYLAEGWGWRSLLVLALVSVWGVRLAVHITVRNWGKGEDWRYRKWREDGPESFWWRSYFRVFILQGLLLVVVAAPVVVVARAHGPAAVTAFDIVGGAICLFGVVFEATADAQLARFKRNPANRGKVFDAGLWRTSRHPNYFGESVVWWGLFLIALSVPGGAWTAIGPVTITFLLLRVSGVRMLEKGLKNRKPGYQEYVRRTSPFVPWPPRRGA